MCKYMQIYIIIFISLFSEKWKLETFDYTRFMYVKGNTDQDQEEFSVTTTLIQFLLDQHYKNQSSPAVTLIKFLHETQNRVVSTANETL